MREYHKITTVYERDPVTNFKTVIEGRFALPVFEYLAKSEWVWTEKVDGTNIRVMWDGQKVTFGGKTDNAQLFAPLVERLQQLFYAGAFEQIFDPGARVCLYGEGYGSKIQKCGGNYKADGVDFTLFDVLVGDTWLERNNVEDISHKFEVKPAPIIGRGNLFDACELAKTRFNSTWGNFTAEGLVMRPTVELKDRLGHRVITKIKCKDFA